MLKNLSITSKLLGRPDPGLAVKRRVRSTPLILTPHTPDVSKSGTPPVVSPPIRGRITVSIREAGWVFMVSSGEYAP